jgi:hypothetical protein
MKTSLYKYFCLLLMTVCCLQAHADESENKGLIHILRVGLAGGGGLHFTPADCVMKGNIGGGGALAFDYAFYKSFDKVDLGLRTGLDLGYLYSPYHAQFEHQYSNVDYLSNQMDYTTSGVVDIAQNQLYASVPLMFALRSNGFVCNLGLRLQMPFYQIGKQQLSNPLVQAYYPKYDVTVTNELITGIVADNQLSTPLEFPSILLECHAAMEIGYEHEIKNKNSAIGVLAYFNMGVWNSLPKATGAPIIQVAPIMDKNNPVPTGTVNNAYNALLTSYIPMQFGLKVYYAFHLTK